MTLLRRPPHGFIGGAAIRCYLFRKPFRERLHGSLCGLDMRVVTLCQKLSNHLSYLVFFL